MDISHEANQTAMQVAIITAERVRRRMADCVTYGAHEMQSWPYAWILGRHRNA